MRVRGPFAAALVLVAAVAEAGPLVRALEATPGALPSEATLAIDPAELARLRESEAAVLEAFPLGSDSLAALDLVRIRPFGPETRIEEVTPAGTVTLPLPDEAYFAGTVAGEPGSRALLVAADDGVRGFVVRGGETYPFGRDPLGRLRVYALRDVDQTFHPGPRDVCAVDLHSERSFVTPPAPARLSAGPAAAPGPNDVLDVDAAIETDTEFRNKFPSSSAALGYLTSLLAAANAVYQTDVKLRLKFTYVRLWSTPDPWSGSDTLDALDEVQAYWLAPANGMSAKAGPRDLVHFVSGKPVTGGIAYLSAVCNQTYAFGVSQVYGSFNLSDPDGIWDVVVFTHELGHNLGSEHTHCYDPPVDECYNGEPQCYSGPESVPPGGGTLMSYCHLLPGGLSNVNLTFGPTVSAQIRGFSAAQACLSLMSACGNGNVDGGETCDDGNVIAGDGCSASCAVEPVCGNGSIEGIEECDDGNSANGDGCSALCQLETVCGDGATAGAEQCDDGGTVAGDGCSATCRLEVCGNAVLDPGETCDDGNVADGDGCSSVCVREPVCGDAVLDDGEECDDGDTASGDGCSATCLREPCQVTIPHQTTWSPAKLVATGGSLQLRGRFGVPAGTVDLPTVAATGIRVLVDGASGMRTLDATLPGGERWAVGAARIRYRDPGGAAGGVRTVVLRARPGDVTTIDVKLHARGGAADPNDAPPTVTVVLGDAAAGDVGACGRHAFPGGECVKRGKKLTCR